jgi:hypothetical protein
MTMREIRGLRPGQVPDEVLCSTEPVVLRGIASGWPLVQAAGHSLDLAASYLLRFYSGEAVVAMLGAPAIRGRYFYNDDLSGFNFTPIRTRLEQVLAELADHQDAAEPPSIYVGSTAVDGYLPGFRLENDLPLRALDPQVSIWIGNRSRIAAHYDLPDNIAVVAAGRRRFTLFPPQQVGNLYVGPLDFTPAGQAISLVDFHHPDLDRFPRFADAMRHAQVADLEAGDAIFIPSMWWHHIEALGSFNVLVNYWWRRTPAWMDTPGTALMHAMLTVRELPPAQRAAWQELFRHYVFEADGSEAAHIPAAARRALAPLTDETAQQLLTQIVQRLER